MTRIIAGSFGGRRLATPAGSGTRPTSDQVREAIFNTLRRFADLEGARVLDLYAGSGALGLEALSRGAAAVTFVESDRRAAAVIGNNVATLGVTGVARVCARRASAYLRGPVPEEPFDVVFADPPYAIAQRELTGVLDLLTNGWLRPDAVLVWESGTPVPPEPAAGWVELDGRSYGQTRVWYGRLTQEAP